MHHIWTATLWKLETQMIAHRREITPFKRKIDHAVAMETEGTREEMRRRLGRLRCALYLMSSVVFLEQSRTVYNRVGTYLWESRRRPSTGLPCPAIPYCSVFLIVGFFFFSFLKNAHYYAFKFFCISVPHVNRGLWVLNAQKSLQARTLSPLHKRWQKAAMQQIVFNCLFDSRFSKLN